MVTTIIVAASLALAVVFTVAWLLKPNLREQIEAPKYLFQGQVRQYDRGLEKTPDASGGDRENAAR